MTLTPPSPNRPADPQPGLILYGGMFNPPRVGHVEMVRKALDALPGSVCLVLPSGAPPWKQDFDPFARYEMTKAAFSGLARVLVSDLEIRMSEDAAGPTFTYDTVERLEAEGLVADYLLIGADQFASLHGWHRSGDLLAKVGLIVAPRKGYELSDIDAASVVLGHHEGWGDSSTELRRRIGDGVDPATLVEEGLLTAEVAEIIRTRRLYRSAASLLPSSHRSLRITPHSA